MKKQTKIKIFKIVLFLVAILPYKFTGSLLTAPGTVGVATAHAFGPTEICTPNQTDPTHNISNCINDIYVLAIGLAGFIAVLMFVWAGYMYMTGGEETISKAKNIFSSTLAALIILFGVYAFLNTLNPNLVNINGVILPKVQCGPGSTCSIPSPATADVPSLPPSGAAGQCQGCVPLASLGVPVANGGIYGTPGLGNQLNKIKQFMPSGWHVTSAFSPNHRSTCHTQVGDCADVVVESNVAQNWVSLCTAAKSAGFTLYNEIGATDPSIIAACGTDHAAQENPPAGKRSGANVHLNLGGTISSD